MRKARPKAAAGASISLTSQHPERIAAGRPRHVPRSKARKHKTRRWRERDSNPRSPVRGTTLSRLPPSDHSGNSSSATATGSFATGTDGSNRSPSASESVVNERQIEFGNPPRNSRLATHSGGPGADRNWPAPATRLQRSHHRDTSEPTDAGRSPGFGAVSRCSGSSCVADEIRLSPCVNARSANLLYGMGSVRTDAASNG
jgi:hypothetical protein